MQTWLGDLLALIAVVVLAPLLGWLGRRHRRAIKGGLGLGLVLMGLGDVIDPPRRHLIEATDGEEEGPTESGEPKVPNQSHG